jgi:hypothetical protein
VASLADTVGELGSTRKRVDNCGAFKEARSIQAKQTSLGFMDAAVNESRKLNARGHAAADEEPKAGPIHHGQTANVYLDGAAGLDPSEGSAHIGSSLFRRLGFTLDSAVSRQPFATPQATSLATTQTT